MGTHIDDDCEKSSCMPAPADVLPENQQAHELRECRSDCGTKALTLQAGAQYFRMRAVQYLYDNRTTNRYYSVREIAKHPDERRQIYRALSRLHAKSGYVMRRKIKMRGITRWKLDRSKTCLAKAKEDLAYMHLQPAAEPKHEDAEAKAETGKEDENAAAAKAVACMIEQKNIEIQSLEEKIRGLEGTVNALESKNQCFRSDFDSYRQRAEKEKEKNRNDMKRDNAKQMLEIADSLPSEEADAQAIIREKFKNLEKTPVVNLAYTALKNSKMHRDYCWLLKNQRLRLKKSRITFTAKDFIAMDRAMENLLE